MKTIVLVYLLAICCNQSFAQESHLSFSSSDQKLQIAFNRAKEMALHYKGKPGDPVGDWYESALPPRSAFCMRDVSHQSIAAEVLDLSDANKNMFTLFAKNISASKDWCSFWEINKFGNPAPADYRNDTAFWYNLNANFDVMTACWNLYLWTGDKYYISNPVFKNFYEKSATNYVSTWSLQPDSLLSRPPHPNAETSFNIEDAFHRCRGLPSYSEGVPNMKMGIDLVAALYKGLLTYSEVLRAEGRDAEAKQFQKKAMLYQQHIDEDWWDDTAKLYNTYYSNNGEFGKTEGEIFLLWFDALKDTSRKTRTIQHLLSGNLNVENMSYFPYLFYINGYDKEAIRYMLLLTDPATKRREYPEVSYGVILGFVKGLMGIEPDARFDRVATINRADGNISNTISNVPLLGTTVACTHAANKTAFTNQGKRTVIWRAAFYGSHNKIFVDGKIKKSSIAKDEAGRLFCYVDVTVNAGKKVMAYTR